MKWCFPTFFIWAQVWEVISIPWVAASPPVKMVFNSSSYYLWNFPSTLLSFSMFPVWVSTYLSLFSFFCEMSAINFLVELYFLSLTLSNSFALFFKKDTFWTHYSSFSEARGESIVPKCIRWAHQKCKGQWLRLNLQGFAPRLLMCKPDDSLYVSSHSLLINALTMLCMTTSIHLENSITWCGGPFNTKNNGQLISQIKIIKSHKLHDDHPHASMCICH